MRIRNPAFQTAVLQVETVFQVGTALPGKAASLDGASALPVRYEPR
jgi:hypothetical protein